VDVTERVTINIEAGVADVRLNRPEKLNALDRAMFAAVAEAAATLRGDSAVRAVVLSGEGRGFCAGLDMAMFSAVASGADDGADRADSPAGSVTAALTDRLPGRITNWAQEVAYGWTDLPQPVIAAVHGACLGGGLQIALGADIRIVAPDATLSVLEIRWGLLPDMTGAQMLPRLVGLDVAKELAFTGRMVPGAEAVALGLCTRLSESPLDDALALAREIAGKNPEAVQGAKALLNAAGQRPLAESFLDESRRMGALIGSADQLEAVTAYVEQREPVFGTGAAGR
jgi:enoyl-CoA hydratase/carnithine racemase